MLQKNLIITIVVIIILILIAGAIIWQYDFTSKSDVKLPDDSAKQQGSKSNFEPTEKKETEKKIPDEFFSYIGKITEISKNQIMLNALANNNNLLQDKILTVNLIEKTVFTKILIPKTLTKDSEKDKIQKIKIKKADLKISQKVLVSADENVAGKTEFTASKVEVQEVK